MTPAKSPIEQALEALEPFEKLFAESTKDFPFGLDELQHHRGDDRAAWGFNNANLTWGDFRRAAQAAEALRGEVDGWRPTHRHVKSGGYYQVIERAKDVTNEHGEAGVEVVIYRGVGGRTWVRRASEFDDERFFQALSPQPDQNRSEGR